MNLESHLPSVLDLCFKSSAILLAAFGAAWLVRRASAARRHLVWLAAFMALAILPLTLAIPPRWSWSWQRPVAARAAVVATLPAAIAGLPASLEEAAPVRPAWRLPAWPVIAGGTWLAVALLLLARQGAGFWKLRGLRRRSSAITSGLAVELAAEFGAVEMRESPLCGVPLTWGWRRPVILLPASASSWPEGRLRAALAHEFGHIARGDFAWRQLAQIVRAFFWPNPLVWLAVRALHRAQEQACDDLVLGRGAAPGEYAMQLLEAARSLATPVFTSPQAVAMALPSTLEGRVRAIVDERRDRRAPGAGCRIATGLAVVAVIAGSAFAQVKSPPAEARAKQQVLIEAKFIEAPEGVIDASDFAGNLSVEHGADVMKALLKKKGVDILSAPSLITRSGERAMIEIGTAGPGSTTPAFKFEVTAWVFGSESNIEMEFTATRTSVDAKQLVDGKPVESSRAMKSTVRLNSGRTCVVLGPAAEKGRTLLIAVTASNVDDRAPLTPKTEEPSRPKYGKPVAGMKGFVTSPHAPEAGEIDVRGLPPGTEVKDPHSGKIFVVPNSSRALAAAGRIILPKVEFREATLDECLDFLRAKSKALSADQQPLNIVVKHSPESKDAKITLSLLNIPLSEVLKYVSNLASLTITDTEDAIVIAPPALSSPTPEPPVPAAPDPAPLVPGLEPVPPKPLAAKPSPDKSRPVTIDADKMRYDKNIGVAEGRAVFDDGKTRITGAALSYDSFQRKVEVTGSARIEADGKVITGEKIIFWPDSGKVETQGPSKTVLSDKPAAR